MREWAEGWTGPSLEVAEVRKIAVFRALHLGDFICAVPALRALRERYPQAEVTLIGLPWVREILDRYSYVDRFLEFPGYRGLEGVSWRIERTGAFLDEAREYGYDLAIQMHGDGLKSNGFVARLGARASLGYRPDGVERDQELDLELSMVDADHEIVRWLRLANAVGADGATYLEFPLASPDWDEADRVLGSQGVELERPVMVLHPGSTVVAKRWSAENFAEAADYLAPRLRAQVVITGAEDELPVACEVARAMKSDAFVVAGQMSLGGLGALLSRARLVLTNDTGPSHLAVAVDTPSVTIFGPTDPARWGPLDTRAHAAVWSGPGNPISAIPVEWVVGEALALVERCAYLTF